MLKYIVIPVTCCRPLCDVPVLMRKKEVLPSAMKGEEEARGKERIGGREERRGERGGGTGKGEKIGEDREKREERRCGGKGRERGT